MFGDPELSDKVANLDDSMSEIIFGEKFGCVTDLDIGPDGLLYITSLGSNTIFRRVPKTMAAGDRDLFGAVGRNTQFLHFVAAIVGIGFAAGGILAYRRRSSGRKKPPRTRRTYLTVIFHRPLR